MVDREIDIIIFVEVSKECKFAQLYAILLLCFLAMSQTRANIKAIVEVKAKSERIGTGKSEETIAKVE